ncbi:MAG: hypothetical protein LUE88_04000 [Clostridiales bacterium]|nr:hypothetical protein [Clostridiales bacterium]
MASSITKSAGWGAAFSVASVWFGTHVGGGFATGNQAIQYYVQYGWMACFLPMIAMGILALVLRECMIMATTRNMYTYKEVFTELWAPYIKMEITMEIFNFVIILAAVGSAIAGAASLLETFGIPYGVAVCIIGLLIVLLVIFGVNLVIKASTVMSIVILVASFTMYFIAIANHSSEIAAVITSGEAQAGTAIWKTLVYSGFQCVAVPSMIAASSMLTKKGVSRASFLGWLMNGLALTVSCIMLLGWHSEVVAAEATTLPNLFICNTLGIGVLSFCYQVSLFFAFISTCTTTIFTMVQKFENRVLVNSIKSLRVRRVIVAIICVLVCMCVSMVGLSNIIKYAYGYCGYLGLVVITLPVLTIGHKKNKEYIATHPESVN